MAETQTLEEAWGWLAAEHETPGGKNDHVLDAARALALAVLNEARPAMDHGTYMICEEPNDGDQCAYHVLRRRIAELGR